MRFKYCRRTSPDLAYCCSSQFCMLKLAPGQKTTVMETKYGSFSFQQTSDEGEKYTEKKSSTKVKKYTELLQ